MSGKRVLDAAALFGAARSIAVQHAKIRAQQFDLYAKTSSLTKALNSVATQGISSTSRSKRTSSDTQPTPTGSDSKRLDSQDLKGPNPQDDTRQINQDTFYDRTAAHSAQDPLPEGTLGVRQEKADRYPLQDGTIPAKDAPIMSDEQNDEAQPLQRDRGENLGILETAGNDDDGSFRPQSTGESTILDPTHGFTQNLNSAEDVRILQRQSEAQIPREPAEPPSRGDLRPADETEQDQPEIFIDQERDTFYQPPDETSPVLSALPRVKLPKHCGVEQGGDTHLPEKLNADTFYSSAEKAAGETSGEEPVSEEMMQSIFQSQKVKRLLSSHGKAGYVPGGVARPKANRGLHTISRYQARATFASASRQAQRSDAAKEEEDVRNLAAEIAKDVNVISKDVCNLWQ